MFNRLKNILHALLSPRPRLAGLPGLVDNPDFETPQETSFRRAASGPGPGYGF